MGNIYGYIRVSSKDQREDRQQAAMDHIHVPRQNLYIDRQSGKDFCRPMYCRLLEQVKEGDLIYIKSIDRLGRNYKEILEQWRLLTKEKRVDLCILDMPLLDTRTGKDLMGTFLADIALAVLSYVAENERANIRQRQAEGIAAARARGVQFGRPPRPMPENFQEIYEKWKRKELSVAEAARECGLPQTTFYDKARAYGKALEAEM